jgi:triphosphoribosyl-dephospho-CoA synthase
LQCAGAVDRLPLDAQVQRIARSAVRALYAELVLEPKPGLVSLRDNGSHTDMSAATFVKSLFALRHYFGHMARAGALAHPFEFLQALGIGAEQRMLGVTGGVNTHRGAVFMLGLLCAAAGRVAAQGDALTAAKLRDSLLCHWGQALRWRAESAAQSVPASNGQRAARRFGLRSAGDEAALGFPTLFEVTWPSLQAALQAGHALRAARAQAFFATMAVLDDTNTAHRGGWEGVRFVKSSAQAFLDAGGVAQSDWVCQARALHAQCVARRLSPGGAADVLAAACWFQELQGPQAWRQAPVMPTVRASSPAAAQCAAAPVVPSAMLTSVWSA